MVIFYSYVKLPEGINQKFHGSLTVGGCILSPEFYMVVGHMYKCLFVAENKPFEATNQI